MVPPFPHALHLAATRINSPLFLTQEHGCDFAHLQLISLSRFIGLWKARGQSKHRFQPQKDVYPHHTSPPPPTSSASPQLWKVQGPETRSISGTEQNWGWEGSRKEGCSLNNSSALLKHCLAKYIWAMANLLSEPFSKLASCRLMHSTSSGLANHSEDKEGCWEDFSSWWAVGCH